MEQENRVLRSQHEPTSSPLEQVREDILRLLEPLSTDERLAVVSSLADMFIPQKVQIELISTIEHGWIDPEEIHTGLQAVLDAQTEANGKHGRRPSWVQRIQEVVLGKENEFIPLDEFAQTFQKSTTSQKTTSRKTAASAISWLNAQFRELALDLELVSENPQRYRDSQTYYHFRVRCLNPPHEIGLQENPEPVDPAVVRKAFEDIIQAERNRARRTPKWYENIWKAFEGRENDIVTLDEIAARFRTKRSAYNALTKTRNALRDYDLEIENLSPHPHNASYRIRKKPLRVPRF